jgi:hypothetical protein
MYLIVKESWFGFFPERIRMDNSTKLNRRDFFKKAGRLILTGGLASVGLYLGIRTKGSDSRIDSCIRNSPCTGCRQLPACPEPKALAIKEKVNIDKTESSIKQENRYE